MQENSSSAIQKSIDKIKFIKWDWQYYSRERSNFQEKPNSRFQLSIFPDWLSNKQETRRPKETLRKTWEKKKKRENGKMASLWIPSNITWLDGLCYEVIESSISQNIFSYLKMFRMQCRKNTTVEDNKKGINIANFTNIYKYTYTNIICDENDSK